MLQESRGRCGIVRMKRERAQSRIGRGGAGTGQGAGADDDEEPGVCVTTRYRIFRDLEKIQILPCLKMSSFLSNSERGRKRVVGKPRTSWRCFEVLGSRGRVDDGVTGIKLVY